MVWFGDVDVPIISDVGTAFNVETVNTNFVDNAPQSYKLYSELEQGTYTVFLNQEIHERSETLSEQRDSLTGMVERHGSEFPINDRSEEGFLLVDAVDIFQTSSEMVDEAEIDTRYLSSDEYKGAIRCNSINITDDFDIEEKSLIPTPSTVSVEKDGISVNPYKTISYSGTDVDYYEYETGTFSWIKNNFDSSYERKIPVRLTSESERIYSTDNVLTDFKIDNVCASVESDSQNNNTIIKNPDGGTVAEVDFTYSDGYTTINTNDIVNVHSTGDETITSFRGYPFFRYDINNRTDFEVNVNSLTEVEEDNHYIVVSNGNGDDVIVVRAEDIGSFTTDNTTVSVEVNGAETSFFVGYVPNNLSYEETARVAFSRGSWRRTFLKND